MVIFSLIERDSCDKVEYNLGVVGPFVHGLIVLDTFIFLGNSLSHEKTNPHLSNALYSSLLMRKLGNAIYLLNAACKVAGGTSHSLVSVQLKSL